MKLDWINAGRAWPRARPGRYPTKSQFQLRCSSSTSTPRFDFHKIESRWRQRWEQAQGPLANKRERKGAKAYILPMFPYPSGVLHLGHLRVYTISDVIARFKHMQGQRVIQPMGWDAFGLPAENAAIERGIDPKEWTIQNIGKMKDQLKLMGGRWDWDREFMTCDPDFYKHTQRIFLLLHSQGLAYQKESEVNYDPVDQTVLANEQVDSEGFSWRSGAKVEKRLLKQWFIRITEYQDALLEDLKILAENDKWPERVLAQQQNWLGKSEGARIPFSVSSNSFQLPCTEIETFTTRLDTLFGVQYLALSLDHPIVLECAKTSEKLRNFLDSASSFPEDSKEGFLLPLKALNPLNSIDNVPEFARDPLPVFVAPYVLSNYGSGAVMGVPAHDTRDFAFWTSNGPEVPVRNVVKASADDEDLQSMSEPFTAAGFLSSECTPFAGLSTHVAKLAILDALSAKTSKATHETKFRLRDWLISRQRYWGTPIPIIHCNDCGAVPVPAHELPVTLPDLPESYFATSLSNPLASLESWHNTKCPSCHGPAKRDTDTMDTFVDSSWYHLRFANPNNHSLPFSPKTISTQLPVDLYIGGVEHAILHLLYARFMTKFLSSPSLGLIPPDSALTRAKGEPFTRLLSQGMVHGKTYTSTAGKALRPLTDLDFSDPLNPLIKETQQTPIITWEKMSKSKHNGVDPTSCIETYGSDTVRAHMLFLAPVAKVLEWDESRIVGVQRWLGRVWRLVQNHRPTENLSSSTPFPLLSGPSDALSSQEQSLLKILNITIASITHALDETYALNTVVSTLMEFTNDVSAAFGSNGDTPGISEPVAHYVLGDLVKLMAPVTPAFAEECWERLHLPVMAPPGGFVNVESVFDVGWPSAVDEALLKSTSTGGELVTCAVQINGKLKFTCEVETEGEGVGKEEWFKEKIRQSVEGKKFFGQGQRLEMGNVKRMIVVGGGKVVNFVF